MKKMLLFIAIGTATAANAQFIDFPDANLKHALVSSPCVNTFGVNVPFVDADTNNDGEIDMDEAKAVTELFLESQQISDLSGIEHFTNLESLNCGNNLLTSFNTQGLEKLYTLNCYTNQLTSLDLQDLPNLVFLNCGYNQISDLKLQGLSNLQRIYCMNNQLTSLDVLEFSKLELLHCSANQLTSLNLTGLVNMEKIWCDNNQLTQLDLKGLVTLRELYCQENQLANLDIAESPSMEILYCQENQITSLDIHDLPNLLGVIANNNRLNRLNAKNGNEEIIGFAGNPDLTCICLDESEYLNVQQMVLQLGMTNTTISIDCDNNNCPAVQPNSDISLYPNPAGSMLYLHSTKQVEKVELIDLHGQILPQHFSDVYGEPEVYVGHLESGLYFLQYFIEGKAHYAKFVKK